MKYLVLLGDGMADLPLEMFGGKTPLEAAHKPVMDSLAKRSTIGMVKTVPDNLAPGSDVANLAVMGYDPQKYYTGRSPLEAASMGVELKDGDITFRCNLVNLSDEEDYENKTMVDYSSDEITTEESTQLMQTINEKLGTEEMEFFPGISYRHLLVWHGAKGEFKLTPPHDITDRKVTEYLPNVPVFTELMKKSYEILKNHPVNLDRIKRGLRPANSIWLWGEGSKPQLDTFSKLHNMKGSVISAVDLVKGIGKCAGMNVVEVENVTGTIDTNFEGKAQAAVNEFKNGADYVYLHFEAPDECGHHGDAEGKVKSIEYLDGRVLKYITEELTKAGYDYSILVMPDHPTPISIKTHSRDAVPFMIYRSNDEKDVKDAVYTEKYAKTTGIEIENGYTLIDKFIG